MNIFSFLKKKNVKERKTISGPYGDDSAANLIYELLFCDRVELFKENTAPPYIYPYDILFAENSSETSLQKIADEPNNDPRARVLACNLLLKQNVKPRKKVLFGVIIEIGLENGLDVLASFNNGTARYINQTGKILVWENTTDVKANELTAQLFQNSVAVVNKIGPWDKPRRIPPPKAMVRISFLVSDGLYFGEGPADMFFNDAMAGPVLATATELMAHLIAQCTEQA